jgi:hypothetical protein
LAPEKLRQANEQLDALIEMGVVVPSKSPWASAIVMAKKKGNNLRMCIDFRNLNEVTIKDAFPLPRIDDSLAKLGSAKYFSGVDVSNAFWQIPLREQDQHFTAFAHPKGLFHWTRMPFGLCNATATFQRLMSVVLKNVQMTYGNVVLSYVDDLLVATTTIDGHLDQLDVVFRALREAGLKLKPEKCDLFKDHIKFLGRVVGKDGVHVDEEATEKIRQWPAPRDRKELMSFLGLTGYYREFIEDYAKKSEPLQRLVKKSVDYVWDAEKQECFEKFKEALVSPPILALPEEEGSFVLDTDASEVAIAGILQQWQLVNGQRKLRVISYGSKGLSDSERSYGAPKKEMLAVVTFVKKYEAYLSGREFTLRTDNSALSYLKTYSMDLAMIGGWAQQSGTIREGSTE